MITLKLSTKTNGIMYKDISVVKVIELTQANVGVNGPRRITIEWTVNDPKMAVTKPVEVTGESSVTQLDAGIPASTPTTPPEKDNEHSDLDKLTETQQASLGAHKSVVLSKIGNINQDEFTTTKFIPIETNLSFAETSDGRISIKYAGTKVNTTWKELLKLEQSVENPIPRGVAVLKENDSGNRRTAVTRLINKMRSEGIKRGDGIKLFNKIFKDKPKSGTVELNNDDTDPDVDFRATGVGASVYPPISPAGQDFGEG